MSAARPADILRHLEQSGAADAELLARFASARDAGAFAELIRRHGALVLGVCRRVTGHRQDAEDAFQATFLVLAQKAGSLRNAALLGNWLYGVAYRVAWRAKRAAARRRRREVAVAVLPEPVVLPRPLLPELGSVLDEELAALPGHYRDAIVLCDVRGAGREEAAKALGVPEGTLSSRLANGRKKLAARLTKRGIALSAAALPVVLADAQAAVVSNELAAKACELGAEYAASGAVPGTLAHLIQGGIVVRRVLLFSVLMGAAVAGAAFAARPNDDAPRGDPPTPAVAEKPQPEAKPKEDAKPGEKAVAFTTTPKIQRALDVPTGGVIGVQWNSTGTHLAIIGNETRARPVGKGGGGLGGGPGPMGGLAPPLLIRSVHLLPAVATDAPWPAIHPGGGVDLAAVSPDGLGVVTALREYQFISGRHHLKFWQIDPKAPADEVPAKAVRSVDLDGTETHGYVFAADGKSYRTVAYHRDTSGAVAKVEVLEVDALTGKIAKSLAKFDLGSGASHDFCANGQRVAILAPHPSDATKANVFTVTVYSANDGKKVSEHTFDDKKEVTLPNGKTVPVPPDNQQPVFMTFSPDGRRLVVSRGRGRTTVLNTDTGEALPELEGTALARVVPDVSAFGGDGRLLVAVCRQYDVRITGVRADGKDQVSWVPQDGRGVLTVWDIDTGKTLKAWKIQTNAQVQAAFNPTRPLLAILEPNGDTVTRVGFWDFEGKK